MVCVLKSSAYPKAQSDDLFAKERKKHGEKEMEQRISGLAGQQGGLRAPRGVQLSVKQ